jgi:hypothetical protein
MLRTRHVARAVIGLLIAQLTSALLHLQPEGQPESLSHKGPMSLL